MTKKKITFPVVITLLLRKPSLAIALLFFILFQIVLSEVGFTLWHCPFNELFNLPCPGCGLTTAYLHLLHFDLLAMFDAHPFAPIFAMGLLLVLVILIFPESVRNRAISFVEQAERKTGFSILVLFGFLIFGVVRLALVIFRRTF
ncbi:DUF2752 domain-containing protein [candidate division KSB1 bacterium]|nr:DUF2752 domain-containing protein [candidate division KSB1 bacterium]